MALTMVPPSADTTQVGLSRAVTAPVVDAERRTPLSPYAAKRTCR